MIDLILFLLVSAIGAAFFVAVLAIIRGGL